MSIKQFLWILILFFYNNEFHICVLFFCFNLFLYNQLAAILMSCKSYLIWLAINSEFGFSKGIVLCSYLIWFVKNCIFVFEKLFCSLYKWARNILVIIWCLEVLWTFKWENSDYLFTDLMSCLSSLDIN